MPSAFACCSHWPVDELHTPTLHSSSELEQSTLWQGSWAVGVMMSGLFAGAVAGPLGVGLLAEHGSFAAAWSLCAALALLAGLVLLGTRRAEAR